MKHQKLNLSSLFILLLLAVIPSCKHISDEIIDLDTLNQRPNAYLTKYPSSLILLDPAIQKTLSETFEQKVTEPWRLEKSTVENTKQTIIKNIQSFKEKPGFSENKQAHKKEWIKTIESDINITDYPNFIQKAITVKNSNLRLIPTFKPVLPHFKHDGGGFPFDRAQNSAILAGTPILVCHVNKKRNWVYVISSFAEGWIDIRDIAYTGPKFLKEYQSFNKTIAITSEDTDLYTNSGEYLYTAKIGSRYKFIKETKLFYIVAVPSKSKKRYAYFQNVKIRKNKADYYPLGLTYTNIVKIADELAGKPYGWGGLYGNRDCSAMIKDLFTPFGIWLPRNSSAQAKTSGTFVNLKTLPEKSKKQIILDSGIPYLTLIWYPGHIMLYIGEHKKEPLIFHNIWGIRTKDKLKRKIIGQSVITTLEPGKHLSTSKESLLSKVEGITFLLPGFINK